MASSFRRFVGRVAVGALAVAVPVVMTPGGGVRGRPTELFFSEYVEGSSNNKALEIYNGTGAAVDLARRWLQRPDVLQRVARRPRLTINLTGHGRRRRRVRRWPRPRPTPPSSRQADQTNGVGWFNGDDAVVLRKGADGRRRHRPGRRRPRHRVGHGPDQHRRQHACAARPPSAPATPTASDAFDPSIEWDGFATDTFDGLGAHTATCAAEPAGRRARPSPSVTPATGGTAAAATVSPTVTFSEAVTLAAAPSTLSCTAAARCATTVTGGPTDLHRRPGRRPAGRRRRAPLTVARGEGHRRRHQRPAGHHGGRLHVDVHRRRLRAPATTTPIRPVQGSGATSRRSPAARTVRGVVVGDYEGPSPGAARLLPPGPGRATATPPPPTAIFVFNGGNQDLVELGDLVTVTGTVGENQGQTQISVTAAQRRRVRHRHGRADRGHPADGERHRLRASTRACSCAMPQDALRHRALPARPLRPGAALLAAAACDQPTNVVAPGAAGQRPAGRRTTSTRSSSTTRSQAQNPDPIVFGRGGQPLSATNTLRGGDTHDRRRSAS